MNIVQDKSARPGKKTVQDRRGEQRERLIAAAERLIAQGGLAALKARDLAHEIGCAVGAIYNLVEDLDDLTLQVARRTKNALESYLDAAAMSGATNGPKDSTNLLVAWAHAYLRFAQENRARWRALFEFRLPAGKDLPPWFIEDQETLFARLETQLAVFDPGLTVQDRKLKARVLFSAVHGIVTVALEEKVGSMPIGAIERELSGFVQTYLLGLSKAQSRT